MSPPEPEYYVRHYTCQDCQVSGGVAAREVYCWYCGKFMGNGFRKDLPLPPPHGHGVAQWMKALLDARENLEVLS